MAESIIKNFNLRLLLLKEWKSQSTIHEATKAIRSKLSYNAINPTKVKYWFKRFDKGDISIFDKKSPLNIKIENRPFDPLNSLIFLENQQNDYTSLIKSDDRFIEYVYCYEEEYFIVQHDLLLGERKKIELPFDFENFKMINDRFLLTIDGEIEVIEFYKIDFGNSTINLLDSIDFEEQVTFIYVDQLDSKKFILLMYDFQFSMGEIHGEKIVLSDVKQSRNNIYFYGQRLVDSKLQGFKYDEELELIEFHEIDLKTEKGTKVDVPVDFGDESLSVTDFDPCPHYWFKNQFYSMLEMSDNQQHLLMFDLDVMKWLNVQIVANKPREMFLDSNEVLTLQVGKDKKSDAFYRISLRKPESLKNLAHLTALRQSTLYANDKYLKCVKSLFIIN